MIERWVVGGEPKAVAEAMGIIDYDEWKDIMLMAEKNITKNNRKIKRNILLSKGITNE